MPKRQKKPKPRLKVRFYHKRKTNGKTIEFSKGKKDPDNIIQTLETLDWSKFDYLRLRNKPDGKHSKQPEGIMVIVTTQKGRKTFTFTKMSPFELTVTRANTRKYVIDTVKEMVANWDSEEGLEDDSEPEGDVLETDYADNFDPTKIKEITVRFFYGGERKS